MKRAIRELLDFHTRFDTGEGFFTSYARSVHEKVSFTGVTKMHTVALSETHKKLIVQAQRQNILHKNIGYVRALQLADSVYYYDIGLKSIDGRIFSRGTSLQLDEAMARAFGELYERVSMRFVPQGELLLYKSYKQLTAENVSALNLFKLAQAAPEQKKVFPDMAWDEESVFAWVMGENLYTGEPTLLPAQLVYWGYNPNGQEPFLAEIDTGGLGAGYTHDEAVASATSELVQRHSFFTYWYAKKAPPRISVQSILQNKLVMGGVKQLIAAVLEYGFIIELLDCTLINGTPSVAVVLTKEGLGWFVGMSTSVHYEKAIERGICEALSTYTWTMNDVTGSQARVFEEHILAAGFCDGSISDVVRVHGWAHPEVAQHGTFFLLGKEQPISHVISKENISSLALLDTLTGGCVYVRRASQTYLDEVQFHSVRTIAPNLYKVALSERFSTPILNGRYPKNTYPHPFP